MHGIARILAAFRRGILQLSQTHCVYMIEPQVDDATASAAQYPARRLAS